MKLATQKQLLEYLWLIGKFSRSFSWFLAVNTQKPCQRIGIPVTFAAGTATRVWQVSVMCWETNILTASNVTKAFSPILARSAMQSLESIPRWENSSVTVVATIINYFCFSKSGLELQRQTLARSMLLVSNVSHLARRQTIRVENR